MDRDIDYAAVAVEKAIREKFGRQNDLASLQVIAMETSISVANQGNVIEGTRDELLPAIRRTGAYADLWQ